MTALQTDTIAALATPSGKSSVAMFRISGPDAFSVCDRILKHRKPCRDFATQTLHRALVVDGPETVDDILVAVFHAPRSYTGEDIVEITCHGGSVPIRRILALLLAGGARQADPGEFTLRAYLNGKLDLAQAEAICDTINARSDESYRLAQAQQAGRLSAEILTIRDSLLGVVARIEATIDFPEDVGAFPEEWCRTELDELARKLDRLIASSERGILYREGIAVMLAGAPNVGKSSLLNALLRQDRAIVTAIPGTTRDIIEESILIRGIPVRLIDTAGLRESSDEVERLGVARTRSTAATADIILMVRDASAAEDHDSDPFGGLKLDAPQIIVLNKSDLASHRPIPCGAISVSALTGEGIEALEERIAETVLSRLDQPSEASEGPTVTHTRHRHALLEARDAVSRASRTLADAMPLDFLSIEAQSALSAIGNITGETAPQEIVNEIFHRFCIGK